MQKTPLEEEQEMFDTNTINTDFDENEVRDLLSRSSSFWTEAGASTPIADVATSEPIKVKSETNPMKLAYFLIKKMMDEQLRQIDVQTIGPRALTKVYFAVIHMNSIVEPHLSTVKFVIKPHVRIKRMKNEQERTALLSTICQVPTAMVV